ncbi:thermonuclease family protein [Erythrobacter sp. QSSC1-22B]|uniref:thermonuclease family protein n=1 Tax=Erythrobacter sp. QSSC1-22B TaxID=1860125 RepID=UPI00082FAC10
MRSLAIALVSIVAVPASAQNVSGPARVVDGDSLEIAQTYVRLKGIDAPELDQNCTRDGQRWRCGEEAATQLRSLAEGQTVTCFGQGNDAHGRVLAVCHANGLELGATMVEYGWATAYRSYSAAYIGHEHRAKSARQGIWRSEFVLPEYHRLAKGEAAAPPVLEDRPASRQRRSQTADQVDYGCTIKGNRSRRGDWIYHLPGMKYYQATRAEEVFCSETEARAAGYRRSKI